MLARVRRGESFNRLRPILTPEPTPEPDSPPPSPAPSLADTDDTFYSAASQQYDTADEDSGVPDSIPRGDAGIPSHLQHIPSLSSGRNMADAEQPGPSGAPSAKRARLDEARAKKSSAGTGTGGAGPDDGGSPDTILTIPRQQVSNTFEYSRTYTKSWKFLSFGLASNIITLAPVAPKTLTTYYLTTPLMSLPVNVPSFYMTPREFNTCARGEYVTHLSVKVTQRNVRVAFQTAATAASLATLNQNKNGFTAIGLNKLGWGRDVEYTKFNDTQKMKPESLKYPTATWPRTFYGVDESNAAFKTTLAAYQTNEFIAPNVYYCLGTNSKNVAGWPVLASKVNCYDATDAAGTVVAEYSYEPSVAPLKLPLKPVRPGPLHHEVNVNLYAGTAHELSVLPGLSAGLTTVQPTANDSSIAVNAITFDQGIEKSHWLMLKRPNLTSTHTPKMQPSLHVGIEAVPTLTTTTLLAAGKVDAWVDTQAYYDIETSMTTKCRENVVNTFGTEPDWFLQDQYYGVQGAQPERYDPIWEGFFTTEKFVDSA